MVSRRDVRDGGSNRGVRDNREKSRRIATDVRFERGVPNSRKVSTGWRKGVVFVRKRTRWSDERRTENGAIFSRDTDRGGWRGVRKEFEIYGKLGSDEFEFESRRWSSRVRSVRRDYVRRRQKKEEQE